MEDKRLSLDEEFTKLLCEVEEEPMIFPSTMVDRWSLEVEIDKLIDQALQGSFHWLGERSMTYICEEYGDFRCENVLSIWPKLTEEGTKLKRPKSVGTKIKIELEKRSDMIEGTPVIHNIGFVTFKLSGKWIVKSLYKMLRYGIDTWSPELPVEEVIIETPDYESPIWNSIVGTEADVIRSHFIRHTLIRMLEYSKVSVKSSEDESQRGVISSLSEILIEEIDGDVVVSTEVEGELESLNFGKRDIKDISNSLKNLRSVLEDQKADWIVYMNHVRHQEFVELCFAVAKDAGWIPTEKHHGLSFAGYRTYAEAGKLVNVLEMALTRCNFLVKQGKTAGYTAERIFTCALGYEYLKNHRMSECTFKVEDMLNEEGDTFLYLLNTKSQVLSVLENSGKDNNIKNVTELIWKEIEVVDKDNGRELGLHLLMFTSVLKESCLSFLPHILCRYLYNLSQKFTSYRSCSCVCAPEFGSVAETTQLILCEATATIMDKCFNLLGLTQVSTFGQSFNEPLKLLLDLKSRMGPNDDFISRCDSVIPSSIRDPLKNSRFEIIAICPQITKDSKFRSGKLFAHIKAEDRHGLLSDWWLSTLRPDFGLISVYDRAYDSVSMCNHDLVSIGNPSAPHSVPLTNTTLRIHAELLVTSESEDKFFYLMKTNSIIMPTFLNEKEKGDRAGVVLFGGDKNDDMEAFMYYYLLNDAVDATLEMNFRHDPGLKVKGEIYAFYGKKFPYNADPIIKRFHTATLLEHDTDLVAGKVPLTRSRMAVPKDGSLVVKAEFVDVKTREVVLKVYREFRAKIEGDSTCCNSGKKCSLDLKVDWTYQA